MVSIIPRHFPAIPRRWCSSSRPPHGRIDQCVGVTLEEPVPDTPAVLLALDLADGLKHGIPAQQTALFSKAISLVVVYPGICLCHCGGTHCLLPSSRRELTLPSILHCSMNIAMQNYSLRHISGTHKPLQQMSPQFTVTSDGWSHIPPPPSRTRADIADGEHAGDARLQGRLRSTSRRY